VELAIFQALKARLVYYTDHTAPLNFASVPVTNGTRYKSMCEGSQEKYHGFAGPWE
jgi:hypothetical protein